MKCIEAKSMFSPYLDGAVTGTEMLALTRHLDACPHCQREYVSLRQTQQLLTKVGSRQAPEDLALKLRLAISREAAQSRRPYFHGLGIRLENADPRVYGSSHGRFGDGSRDFRISDGVPGLALASRQS